MRFCLENWDPDDKIPQDIKGNHYIFKCWYRYRYIYWDLVKQIAKETDFEGEIIWDHTKPDGTPKTFILKNKNYRLGSKD